MLLPPLTSSEAYETLSKEISQLLANLDSNNSVGDEGITVRGHNAVKIDLSNSKFEAMEIFFQSFQQNGLSLWSSLLLSRIIAEDCLSDILSTSQNNSELESNEINVSVINAPQFSKTARQYLKKYLNKLMASPDELKSQVLPSCFPFVRAHSVCGIKNTRRKMEDRYVMVPALGLLFPNHDCATDSFYAVFDGHIGQECANYAAVHFLHVLMSAEHLKTDPQAALTKSFQKFDSQLCKKCESEKIRSGCTALVGIFLNGKLYVAWAGDSQAALCYGDQKCTIITPAHSPDSETEYNRIEAAGGVLMTVQGELRVNGVLNVSRSFGDCLLKPVLTAEPDVLEVELTETEYFLILACDGLWDALEPEQCVDAVREFVRDHSVEEYADMASYLVEKAKNNGSTDNITAVFVYLKHPKDLWHSFR